MAELQTYVHKIKAFCGERGRESFPVERSRTAERFPKNTNYIISPKTFSHVSTTLHVAYKIFHVAS